MRSARCRYRDTEQPIRRPVSLRIENGVGYRHQGLFMRCEIPWREARLWYPDPDSVSSYAYVWSIFLYAERCTWQITEPWLVAFQACAIITCSLPPGFSFLPYISYSRFHGGSLFDACFIQRYEFNSAVNNKHLQTASRPRRYGSILALHCHCRHRQSPCVPTGFLGCAD